MQVRGRRKRCQKIRTPQKHDRRHRSSVRNLPSKRKIRSPKKIIDFSEHYRNNDSPQIQKPLSKNFLKDLVDPQDLQFINLPNQQQLLELLLASNYLDIKALIEPCCAKVATMIKEKSPKQIRQQFGIVKDFTPQDESQIREQNKWTEEWSS